MNHCGFDSGKKSSQICIMNDAREIVSEKRVGTTELQLRRTFAGRPRMRITIEASTKSFWIADILESCGHEVVVVDPRRTKAIGAALIKHDKLDARILARLSQADILAPVHRPPLKTRYERMTIVARDTLVRTRTHLINAVRSLLDSEGIVVAACGTEYFTTYVRELPDGLPESIACATDPMLTTIDHVNASIAKLDTAIKKIAVTDPLMKRLQTVDGVGPIVSAIFVNAIGDASRFNSARKVGAYLGLVPSLYQSGATNKKGRITKQGNRQARFALTMAANALIRSRRSSSLKTWALSLVEKHGRKKALVALARKLAGVLWAMWKNERDFIPSMPKARA